MKKFITERTCWHNGKYYEEGAVVECDCEFCKKGEVSYFTPIDEENVSQETKFEEKVDKADDAVKEEIKPKKRNKIEIV